MAPNILLALRLYIHTLRLHIITDYLLHFL